MGCWHGCGRVHCGPTPRGRYGPADEDDWSQDVTWPLAPPRPKRAGGPRHAGSGSRGAIGRAARAELRRVEAALADFGKQA